MTPHEIAALNGASLVEESTRAAYVAFPDNDKAVNVGLRVCIDNLLSMTNESPVSSAPMVTKWEFQCEATRQILIAIYRNIGRGVR
jgi:hypothetical protein